MFLTGRSSLPWSLDLGYPYPRTPVKNTSINLRYRFGAITISFYKVSAAGMLPSSYREVFTASL